MISEIVIRKLKTRLIYSVRFTFPPAQKAYYYILVDALKERLFLQDIKSKVHFNLKDYGTILASGYGNHPPAATQKMLKEKYDYDTLM